MTTEPLVKIVPMGGHAAALYLNRPEKKNALSVALLSSFLESMEKIGKDREVRTLFILPVGDDFCTGMDLKEALDEKLIAASSNLIEKAFLSLLTSPKVTVSCVKGKAFAGGAGLALSSDFLLMEEGSFLAFPEVKRGLVPALVAALLAHKTTGSVASRLLLLAEEISAKEAVDLRIASQTVPKGDLINAASNIAKTTLAHSPLAIAETKKLLLEISGIEEAFSKAALYHTRARRSKDALEGVRAFLEKRDPSWKRTGI